MKRTISLILVVVLLFNFTSYGLDGSETNQELVAMMKDQGYSEHIEMGLGDKQYLNPHVYREQQKVVYSASSDFKDLRSQMQENLGQDNVDRQGDFRYLGYNTNFKTVANELFEPDVSPYDGHLSSRKWIKSNTSFESWYGIGNDLSTYMLNTVVKVSSAVGTDTIKNILGGVSDYTAKTYATYQSSPGVKVEGSVKMYHEIEATGDILYWVMNIPSLASNITNHILVKAINDQEVLLGDAVSFDVKTVHNSQVSVTGGLNLKSIVKSYSKAIEIENMTTNTRIYSSNRDYEDFSIAIDQINKSEKITLESSKFEPGINQIRVTTIQTLNPTLLGDGKLVSVPSVVNFNVINLKGTEVIPTLRLEANPLSVLVNGNNKVSVNLHASLAGRDLVPSRWKFYLNDQVVSDVLGNGTSKCEIRSEQLIETKAPKVFNWNGKVDIYLNDTEFVTAFATATTEVYDRTPPDTNTPPYGSLNFPSVVETNTSVIGLVTIGDKEDPDSALTTYFGFPASASHNMTSSGGTASFSEVGDYEIEMIVVDSNNKQSRVVDTVTVIPPRPTAVLETSGHEIQYRKIELSLLNSYVNNPTYPIDGSKTEIEITGLDNQSSTSIYTKDITISNLKSFKGSNFISIQSNSVGRIMIKATVYNVLGESDVVYKVLDIAEDLKPVASLSHISKIYRDPSDKNQAVLNVFNDSFSPDKDTISNIKLYVTYDQDNDGRFDDESPVLNYSGPFKQEFLVASATVGKRRLTLEVTEDYTSMATLVAPKLSGTIATEFEVDNIAPTTTFDIETAKETIEVKYVNVNGAKSDAYLNAHYNNILKPYLSSQYKVAYQYLTTDTQGYMKENKPVFYLNESGYEKVQGSDIDDYYRYNNNLFFNIGNRTLFNTTANHVYRYQNFARYKDHRGDYQRDPNVGSFSYNAASHPYTWNLTVTDDGKYFSYLVDKSDAKDDVQRSYIKSFINKTGTTLTNNQSEELHFFDIETSKHVGSYSWSRAKDIVQNIVENSPYAYSSRINYEKDSFTYKMIGVIDGFVYLNACFDDNRASMVIGFDIKNMTNYRIIKAPNPSSQKGKFYVYKMTDTSKGQVVFKIREWIPYQGYAPDFYCYPTDMLQSSAINISDLIEYTRPLKITFDGALTTDFDFAEFRHLGTRKSNIFSYTEDIVDGGLMYTSTGSSGGRRYRESQKKLINKDYYFAYDKYVSSGYSTDIVGYLYKYNWSNNFLKTVENMEVDPTRQTFVVFFMKDYQKLLGDSRYIKEFAHILEEKKMVPIFVDASNSHLSYFDGLNTLRNGASTTNDAQVDTLIGSRIVSEVNVIDGILYITKNIGLQLSSLYSDYEKDPMFDSKFEVHHVNPLYFENSEGMSSYNNLTIGSNNTLDKVGEYNIQARVQDNPSTNILFSEYRKWSKTKNQIPIRLHRKPVVNIDLDFALDGTVYNTSFVNNSYDLDHLSLANKGIAATKLLWKEEKDLRYQTSIPPQVAVGTYSLIVKVKDLEGVWSEATYNYQLSGLPVAISLNTVLTPTYPRVLKNKDQLKITGHVESQYPVVYVNANVNGKTFYLTKMTQLLNQSTWVKTIDINRDYLTGDYTVFSLAENSVGIQARDEDVFKVTNNLQPLILNGEVKATEDSFSIYAIPSTESLTFYDIETYTNAEEHLQLSLSKDDLSHTSQKTAYFRGTYKGEHLLWQDILYDIPSSFSDGDYTAKIKVVDPEDLNNVRYKNFPIKVYTPIDLVGKIPHKMMTGSNQIIKASTSKYVDQVTVTLFKNTEHEVTQDMASIDGTDWILNYTVPDTVSDKLYEVRFTASVPSEPRKYEHYDDKVETTSLRMESVDIWGQWHHWRGQVDLFGQRKTIEPHRFLSLEKLHIAVETIGNPDEVLIEMSDELEAMSYVDSKGNTYDYKDLVGYTVDFPVKMQPSTNDSWDFDYILPLAASTKSEDNLLLSKPYYIKIILKKGLKTIEYIVDDIHITGNTLDHVYIQDDN